MKTLIQFTHEIFISDQPTEDDIAFLANRGILSVVNLRQDREPNQPLSPQEEEKITAKHQLQYYHFPMILKTLTEEDVDQFRVELQKLPTPILVHCQRGIRAAAIVIMDYAIKKNMSGEEGLAYVRSHQIDFHSTETDHFIKNYIDKRNNQSS